MEEYHSKKWRKFNSDKVWKFLIIDMFYKLCEDSRKRRIYKALQGFECYETKGKEIYSNSQEKSLRPLIFSKEAKSIEQSEDCNQA